jgi:hypothetical protein
MVPRVAVVDKSDAITNEMTLNVDHEMADNATMGKNHIGSYTKANSAVVPTESTSENNISLHLPSLSERALAGTRVRTETSDWRAIINPSSNVVEPTLTMKRGRIGSDTAVPSRDKNVTAPTTSSVFEPANRCID